MKNTLLQVSNSGVVALKKISGPGDSILSIGEAHKEIPFEIKRIYTINFLENCHTSRGGHAHFQTKQVIFCLWGSFILHLDDGKKKQVLKMDPHSPGIILGNLLWHTMENFSPDCNILVVASDFYLEEDYIREYSNFQKIIRNQK